MGQRRRYAGRAGQTEKVDRACIGEAIIRKNAAELKAKAKKVAVKKPTKDTKNVKSDGTWFVYLLRCADGSLYTGITNDVPRRVEKHNAGKASRYTRSRLPAVLVYQEPQPNRSMALKRELAIKAVPRREKESLIQVAALTTRRVKSK